MAKKGAPAPGPVRRIDPASLGLSGPQKISPKQSENYRTAIAEREAAALSGPHTRQEILADFARYDQHLAELNATDPTPEQLQFAKREAQQLAASRVAITANRRAAAAATRREAPPIPIKTSPVGVDPAYTTEVGVGDPSRIVGGPSRGTVFTPR